VEREICERYRLCNLLLYKKPLVYGSIFEFLLGFYPQPLVRCNEEVPVSLEPTGHVVTNELFTPCVA
jgi:hypothetical protein